MIGASYDVLGALQYERKPILNTYTEVMGLSLDLLTVVNTQYLSYDPP